MIGESPTATNTAALSMHAKGAGPSVTTSSGSKRSIFTPDRSFITRGAQPCDRIRIAHSTAVRDRAAVTPQ